MREPSERDVALHRSFLDIHSFFKLEGDQVWGLHEDCKHFGGGEFSVEHQGMKLLMHAIVVRLTVLRLYHP